MSENPDAVRQIIAYNIRKYRTEKQLSQEELATICDLHRTYIGSIERCERNLTLNTLCTLANALDITLVHLLSTNEKD